MLFVLVIMNQLMICYNNSQISNLINFIANYLIKQQKFNHFLNLIMLAECPHYL